MSTIGTKANQIGVEYADYGGVIDAPVTDVSIGVQIGEICYGNGLYVAVGRDVSGNAASMHSTDGIFWSMSTSLGSIWGTSRPYRITFSTFFVAISSDGKVATSTDGITWTNQTALSSIWGVNSAYGLCWTGSKFVVAGANGKVATSTDGITWTNQTGLSSTTFSTATCMGLRYLNGKIFAYGDTGKLAYSIDGITWTYTGSIVTAWASRTGAIYDIAYNGTTYVAVGGASNCATSSDGVTWTNRASLYVVSGSQSWIYTSVVWNGLTFITTGQFGRNAWSYDGISWVGSGAVGSVGMMFTQNVNGRRFAYGDTSPSYMWIPDQLSSNTYRWVGSANVDRTITLDFSIANTWVHDATSQVKINLINPKQPFGSVNSLTVGTLFIRNIGKYDVKFNQTIKWQSGIQPKFSGNVITGYDQITIMSPDSGTTWYGFHTGTNK